MSKLVAIEELAGVDVLCSDKTGTLTQNKLTLGDPFSVNGIPADQVILDAALASRADNNDTIDLAVLAGLKDKDSLKAYDVVHFQPFDPVHKRTEATVKAKDGKTFKVTKGAPQVILALSANAEQVKPAVEKAVNEFAARGFRSLGVARAEGDGPWQFVGVLPLFDPPREDAKATIATARADGRRSQDGHGRCTGHRRGNRQEAGHGHEYPRRRQPGRLQEARDRGSRRVHRKGRRLRAGLPRTQVSHRRCPAKTRPHCRHDGRRGERRPRVEEGRLRHRRFGRDRRGPRGGVHCAGGAGLSVIIDAIKESRKIFQRMNSYAIYRIAETLRVLLLMTLAILIFKFYPVTAVMIVMIALLNDGAILSIAYDNVHYKDKPEAWNMRMVLGISTVLGVIGVVSAFGLFYLGERVFHLDRAHIQTLMYLKLSVAGHLTIFLTRTRGPFWSIRPARILWVAVLGTQIVATLIAVYGLFMTPLGWGWALFVWGYALAWFLVNDRVKLLAYQGVRSNYLAPIGQETMIISTQRINVDLADKRAARIPSLVTDLANTDPTVRTKARKALVAIGKTHRAFTHSTPFASKTARAMGSSQGAVRYRRSACRFRAGQCLGRPRWRRALAGGRGFGRSGPRWSATSVGGTAPAGSIMLVLRGRTPRLSHFGQEKKARPDSAACIGGPERIRAGSCGAAGCLYRTIETARVVVRTR